MRIYIISNQEDMDRQDQGLLPKRYTTMEIPDDHWDTVDNVAFEWLGLVPLRIINERDYEDLE